MSTSTIIAHEEIEGRVHSQVDFAKDFGKYGEQINVEIQHDPCCPGKVCIGVLHESQRMQVVSLYLNRDRAYSAALALLAAVAHIDHQEKFTNGPDDGSEEQWRDAHARAMDWVMDNMAEAKW
jgi:hypothetical protein